MIEDRVVQTCPEKIRPGRPITEECVAAALAENAFLVVTKHKVTPYTIHPVRRTPKDKDWWLFIILEGDDAHPPPPGGHFFATVYRASGKVDLTPGE
jgi:hypothetical protein